MNQVCATGPIVKGIDIYHGDQISDVNKLKTAVSYVFLKAFEFVVDPLFQSRWRAMKIAGITRGAYDFFHPGRDPITQADIFSSIVGPLESGDLPPALDWEVADGTLTIVDRERGLQWLERVEKHFGMTPLIYGSSSFLEELGLDARFARFPVWVAHYKVKYPRVPHPWKTWTFWQGSEKGIIPGINGECDSDQFNGNLDDLRRLCKP